MVTEIFRPVNGSSDWSPLAATVPMRYLNRCLSHSGLAMNLHLWTNNRG
ncbi:hypothetical protein MYCOZU1_00414 [Mycobacterium intracellulare subsp. chimaera]|nr:hypothetical protein MYCOZU1_00414 [Mycobacterium intracellulare subsp. chimaera]